MPVKRRAVAGTPIPETQWEWYGLAGHFICGTWCRFHMTTKVGRYLISTVGQYVHPRHAGGAEMREREWLMKHPDGEELGPGRFYETMVFEISGTCLCGCGQPKIDSLELDTAGYKLPGPARAGHMKMCHRWADSNRQAIGRVQGDDQC